MRRPPLAEVELLHVLVGPELFRLAVEHDTAVLHDVPVVRDAERQVGVLLDQEEGGPLLALTRGTMPKISRTSSGASPSDGSSSMRAAAAPSGRGRWRASAARRRRGSRPPGGGGPPRPGSSRTPSCDRAGGRRDPGALAARSRCFLDGEVLEDPAALHHLEDAPRHLLGRSPLDPLARRSAMQPSVTSPSSAWRRPEIAFRVVLLPAPFDAEQRDDLPLGHLEREPLQHQDHVVVDDLDVLRASASGGSPPGARGGGGARGPAPAVSLQARATPACAACRTPSTFTSLPFWIWKTGVFVMGRWSSGRVGDRVGEPAEVEVLQRLECRLHAGAVQLAGLVGALQPLGPDQEVAQPRTYIASCVSFGWFALWKSTSRLHAGHVRAERHVRHRPGDALGRVPRHRAAAPRRSRTGSSPNLVARPSTLAPFSSADTPVVVTLT